MMKKKLGNFELLEQIDPGGYTVVWRAVEHMGFDVTRPAAVKLLQGWRTDDPTQVEMLKREVRALADICTSPHIVTIYAFDIDPEIGPWIAMELGGKSLKHFITDDPVGPERVRQLLRDLLRALIAVHNAKPQILHRDLKPNNILSTEFGSWKLADFGLAKRNETESTLNVLTVQYSAPELLDGKLGKECPATDLYALGLLAYEYALGRKLYRAQFPSIYDPYSKPDEKKGDDRPKWMYWHTSMQMTLKPLSELIEGFPEDLSQLIADMTAKPVEERVQSAAEALTLMREASEPPSLQPAKAPIDADEEKKSGPSLAIILACVAMLGLAGAGMWLYWQIATRPSISLRSEVFKSDAPGIPVTGKVFNFPKGGQASIALRDGTRHPVIVDSTGSFSAEVRVPKLGQFDGTLAVRVGGGAEIVSSIVKLERLAPKEVKVIVGTRPPVSDAVIRITEAGEQTPIIARTGPDGTAEALVAHGKFNLEVIHPRFEPINQSTNTGIDPELRTTALLAPLTESQVTQKRRLLVNEVDELTRRIAEGDAGAAARLTEIQAELLALESSPGTPEARRRASILQEMLDTAERALKGDPRAAERLAELRNEVREAEQAAFAAAGSNRRQDLMNELNNLTEQAAAGDPTAIGRLRQVQAELRQLDVEEGATVENASRRARLMNEITELAEKASRGDRQAIARMREVRRELEQMEAPVVAGAMSSRRQSLMGRIQELASRAAEGDIDAVAELKLASTELEKLDKEENIPAAQSQRRSRILEEMNALAERASKGDIDAAVRLKGLQRELDQSSRPSQLVTESNSDDTMKRRTALLRELGELIGKAVGGDPSAVERMRKIRQELQVMDVSSGGAMTAVGRRRAELLSELTAATELAANGDAKAHERLVQIQREMAVLTAVEQSGGDSALFAAAATEMLGGTPSLDLIDRSTLLALSEADFAAFVSTVVPRGAITVEAIPNLRRLRVSGPVLNEREMQLLMVRLEPALPRLVTEVRLDPWAVCRRLAHRLESAGAAGVRVHAHLMPNDNALYVQYERKSGIAESDVRRNAHEFVIDQDLIMIQPVSGEPTEREQKPAASAEEAAGAVEARVEADPTGAPRE